MKKTNILLIFTFMFSIMLIQSSSAYFGWDWYEGNCTSNEDPLYIEMPDSIHSMIPTSVSVYINDPIVKEYADYAVIQAGNSNVYPLSGNQFSRTSGGVFREAMAYGGESSIQFGFRPTDQVGYTNSVIVTFYMVKKVSGNEYPDTYDESSPFFGYDCNWEYNDLLCSDTDGCLVCNHPVGQVTRYFMMSETEESITIPSRVDFVDEKVENEWTTVGFQSLYYDEDKKYISEQGNEHTSTDLYTIRIDTQELWGTFEEYKENDLDGYIGPKDNIDNPDVTVNDISAPGPELSGKAYEMVYNKPINPQNGADFVDIYYQLFAEMTPVGSGVMIVKATRQTVFEKGTGSEDELESIRNDISNILSSYSFSRGQVIEPEAEDYMVSKWYVKSQPEDEDETVDEYYVAGHISDYFDHPLPYMKIIAEIEGLQFEGITDEDGIYRIPLTGIELEENEEKEVKITATFQYIRNNNNYFDIKFRKPNNRYTSLVASKEGTIIYGEHLQIDFRMDDDEMFTTNLPDKTSLKHHSLIYFHTGEAVEFVLETLKEDMDKDLPVTIYVGNRDGDTLYSPARTIILIAADCASLSDSNRPDNREYHEFMHALMYDIYNAWPADSLLQGTVNHNGFHNPSTADSYIEGFAEFMAMVVSDYMGEPSPEIYAGFGSMDQNYVPWDARGFDEEFAVASVLWDIYDEHNEEGDELSMTIQDMWKVLKVNRKDFYDYYEAFKMEFPEDADKFDKIFILHKMFDDTRAGNRIYDKGEPWRYEGQGANRRALFIDLSGNISSSPIVYEENLTIGKVANPGRNWRSSAKRIDGAYLKVVDDEVDFYKVVVAGDGFSYEYVVDRKEGMIYIQPLPSDVDAMITVVPFSEDYAATDAFMINSAELNDMLFSEQAEPDEFFDEHEFNLKKTGNNADEKYDLYEDIKPTYGYEGDLGKDVVIKEDSSDDFGSEETGNGKGFSFGKAILILVLAAFVFFYFKKPGFKKRCNSFFRKLGIMIKKAYLWFLAHGVPAIKKFLRWFGIQIVKLSRLLFHHGKKGYHKVKNHIKERKKKKK